MKHLFKKWANFAADRRAASHLLLLADYDGTLTPIVGKPADAVLSSSVKDKLQTLAARSDVSLGVISGRELAEIASLVGIKGIYYAGNHGLEMEGPGLEYTGPAKSIFIGVAMAEMAAKIAAALADVPGIIIQDKGLSLSVHYRLAPESEEARIAGVVRQVAEGWVKSRKIQIFGMKKVWEIRPLLDWDKGKAVQSIQSEIIRKLKPDRLLTVFLGDDTTDEDAFKVLRRPSGWSVFVGEGDKTSAAAYYLVSPAEVEEFLSRLIEMKL
ncbi:MAG: trehalose-phosphatase [Dehalococcoidales bacterium]|jgi:trehalose-phosphatase